MLNRWLARFKIDPDTLRQQKWFALFGERLLTPALWQGGTRALCGAVAAGLFASWVPMPMHSLVAVALVLNETPAPFHLTWSLHWLEQEAAILVPPFLLGSLLLAVLSAAAGALLTLLLLQLGKLARPR
ncbi:DUF2062 domain-containing protein [Aeromonas caviae]|uniref:DUF2062 domain-containing protein n=1 Tax=Aeromonas caviae TaxID=648 RepID=UPI001904F5C4|nr:DUF2062 domain-containing protein [Aeromonas caviae]QQM75444.1 DUF2062 domain-containing protein [Aeromonas caviae]QQV18021.1 DUF2062 domain-containing protein [Aeromonas caviae]